MPIAALSSGGQLAVVRSGGHLAVMLLLYQSSVEESCWLKPLLKALVLQQYQPSFKEGSC